MVKPFKLGLYGGNADLYGRNAARQPAIHSTRSFDDDSSSYYSNEFVTREIRHAFIKKVYCILFIQLGFTAGVIALFVFEPNTNRFARRHYYISIIFLIAALIIYMVLVCGESCRKSYPLNIILLSVYTILSSIGFAALAANYSPEIVFYSFAITAGICLLVTIIAMQKCIDITGCGMYLCIIGMVLMLFSIIVSIVILIVGWNETTRILYVVYASIGALVASLYFMFMTQLILGGKKYSLSPEEYVLGAIVLYTEVMHIFTYILTIFGMCSH